MATKMVTSRKLMLLLVCVLSYVYIRVMLPGVLKTTQLEKMKEERHLERDVLEFEELETEEKQLKLEIEEEQEKLKSQNSKKDQLTAKQSASPEYGLDFQLEYRLDKEGKERKERGEIFPPNQTLGPDCDRTITLDRIEQVRSIKNGLFLIESSGRETINARQACAVESAARQSGMEVHLVVTSTQLDLRDNTTCYLYMANTNIKFYSIDIIEFSLVSPLEKFFKSDILEKSSYKAVHTADAVRLLLVYRFGGFYLDLDYVVMRDLNHYKNMVLQETGNPAGGIIDVTNSALKFTKGHSFLMTAMEDLQQRYDPGCWGCIGPTLLTRAARKHTNVSMINEIPPSADLSVTLMKRMMPVFWTAAQGLLFPEQPVSFQGWETLFKDSSTVHFFNKMTTHLVSYDDPQYSAYAFLGPRYCPNAYFSTQEF